MQEFALLAGLLGLCKGVGGPPQSSWRHCPVQALQLQHIVRLSNAIQGFLKHGLRCRSPDEYLVQLVVQCVRVGSVFRWHGPWQRPNNIEESGSSACGVRSAGALASCYQQVNARTCQRLPSQGQPHVGRKCSLASCSRALLARCLGRQPCPR